MEGETRPDLGAGSWRRFVAFSAIAAVPTAFDVSLLTALRVGWGWPLIVADLVSIAGASVASYLLHRATSRRANPYARWVQAPLAFVMVAVVAGAVDVFVLRLLFTATGYESIGGVVLAKFIAVGCAVLVRIAGYRYILADLVRENRVPGPETDLPGSVRLTVVVPAYQEPERIATTVARIRHELADVADDGGLEIVVVDDGSGDGTAEAARDGGADQVIVQPRNRGKGAAVRAGMLASTGRVVCFTDADLAYDPPHLRRLLAEVERGWDVVIGSRRHPESRVSRSSGLRLLGSILVNRVSGAVLLARPLDTQCGLKGFRGDVARSVFAQSRIDGFAFDIEVLHLVERAGYSLTEIPVNLDESDEPSTVRVGRDVVQLALDMLRIRRWSTSGAYDAVGAPRGRAPA